MVGLAPGATVADSWPQPGFSQALKPQSAALATGSASSQWCGASRLRSGHGGGGARRRGGAGPASGRGLRRRAEKCGGAAPALAGNRAPASAGEGGVGQSGCRLGPRRLPSRSPRLGSATDSVSVGVCVPEVSSRRWGGPRRVPPRIKSRVAAKPQYNCLRASPIFRPESP